MIPEDWNTTKSFELNRATAADPFVWLMFKPELLLRHDIPATIYPLRSSTFDELVRRNGVVSIIDIVRGLMDWLDFSDHPSPVSKTLREIIDRHYPPSQEKFASCEFEFDSSTRSRFRLDPIDTKFPMVSWFRQDFLIAVGGASSIEPELLTIAVPSVLTLRVVESILDESLTIRRFKGISDMYLSCQSDRSQITHFDRSVGRVAFAARDDKRSGLVWLDNHEASNPRMSLPSSEKWLSPNQIAVMMAIGGGYL